MARVRIATRELGALRREKTIILAIIIQLFIAGFSSFLLVGLVSLYDPGSVTGNGITIGVTGDAGEDLAASIESDGPWGITRYETPQAAETAFHNGHVDAVLIATTSSGDVVRVRALVPDESVRSTVIVVQVRDALQAFEHDRRVSMDARLQRAPLAVPDLPSIPPTFIFTYTVLLPLLMFLPAFISGSIAADAITEEIDAGTLELLLVTPLEPRAIIDGKMLATIALVPVQAATWLALLWANGTPIHNPLPILLIVTATGIIVVAIGTGLAATFGNRQATQLVYSLAVILVFALASILPESPPNTIAKFAIASPTPMSHQLVGVYIIVAVGVCMLVRRGVAASLTSPYGQTHS